MPRGRPRSSPDPEPAEPPISLEEAVRRGLWGIYRLRVGVYACLGARSGAFPRGEFIAWAADEDAAHRAAEQLRRDEHFPDGGRHQLGGRSRALEQLAAPVFAPKAFGLTCPHCHLRSMTPVGGRVYVCTNPKCPGEARVMLGACVSMVTIDPLVGAQLRPWEEVTARDRARKADPRGFLRGIGAIA